MNPLCGDSLGVVAHKHVGEMCAVMDAVLAFGEGLDDTREVRFVKICKSITLACVKADFVWGGWEVVVR